MIRFNKPHLVGKETDYIIQTVESEHISGNGVFTKKCQHYFEERYGFKKALLTTSCTDALEMCAMLANIQPGDEVIVPSFTFVSTALAFVRQGAKIVFADSCSDHPNIDADKIESLITSKTKAIVPVHYAGIACEMDKIMALAKKYDLWVIEDAAQAIDSYYKGKPLGSIGHLAAFSFHETKNITSGEGGLLVVNDERLIARAEIIWEKGTNRAEFYRGKVNKYGWVDTGSSFLPAEIIAAFLWAQLEALDEIQAKRKLIWELYYSAFEKWSIKSGIKIPDLPDYATNNGHLFYLVCNSLEERTKLMQYLTINNIETVFHYLSLHSSKYYADKHDGRILQNADKFTDCLLRLPLHYELSENDVNFIIDKVKEGII